MQPFILWLVIQLFKFNQVKSTAKVVYCNLSENINLTCPGNPNTTTPYSWSREIDNTYIFDREVLEPSIMNEEKYRIFSPNILQISGVTERDEGTYGCYTTKYSGSVQLKLMIPISGLKILPNPDEPYIYGRSDDIITATANESLTVRCTVSRSRPRPLFYVHVENRGSTKTVFEHNPEKYKASPTADGGYVTEAWFTARYVDVEDNGRPLVCTADLNLPDVKPVETSVKLSVLFAPVCAKTRVFYLGLRRFGNISCTVLKANPSRLKFDWTTSVDPSIIRSHFQVGMTSYLKIRPTSIEHFRSLSCIVSNGVHSPVVCPVILKLGAYPDPISECKWIYHTNTTIQITCKLGFDQGDPDQQCVMFRFDTDRNEMIEYARSRLCSFVIDHTTPSEYHKLQIFSVNKFGSNIKDAVILEINRVTVPPLPTRKYTMILIIGGACAVFLLLIVCCCLYGQSSSKINSKKDKHAKETAKFIDAEDTVSLFPSIQNASNSSDCVAPQKKQQASSYDLMNSTLTNGFVAGNGNLMQITSFQNAPYLSDNMLLVSRPNHAPPVRDRNSISRKTKSPPSQQSNENTFRPKVKERPSVANSKITEC